MPQYLVSVYHPTNYAPSLEDAAMMEEIHALNREMIAAGVRNFAGGLSPASSAKSLRTQPEGAVAITDGPYLEAKEYIGGFWILETHDMDQAVAWARKATIACRTPVEVREIFVRPAPKKATAE